MKPTLLRQIDADLVLRRAVPEDADRLAEFNARVHGENPDDARRVAVTMRDLLAGRSPVFPPEDFTIVEDARAGKIVSSMCLFSQTWSYSGITFPAGQPEFVGTDPDYRNRGLVRLQFEVIHAWSKARGQILQGITGIPNFYRQYGYEMVAQLDGFAQGYADQAPALPQGKEETYRLRPPRAEDLDFILSCYRCGNRRYVLSMERSREEMQYEVFGKSAENVVRREFALIERIENGEPVGVVAYQPWLLASGLAVTLYELKPGVSWLEVTPAVIRHLWKTGQEIAGRQGGACTNFTFTLGDEHPVYRAVPRRLPRKPTPYAWYIRIPDIQGFLARVRPVLEQRLAASICCGHSGELTIGFFRGQGLRLVFERGHLVCIEDYAHTPVVWPHAYFPELTFYQLLLGYRSLAELEYAYPDCAANSDEGQALLPALFPRQSSHIWPLI